MIRPLCIATRGLLSNNTTSIATRGYLCAIEDSIELSPVQTKKFADDSGAFKKLDLIMQDEEILTILKIFITCQDRVLRS